MDCHQLPPTNRGKWNYFLSDCTSPDIFIEFGFYYLIAASLQRRVWFGNLKYKPLFPNIYPILVGRPGVGKGLVIDAVASILREHKLKEPFATEAKNKPTEDLPATKIVEQELVIPIAANATTFEKLVTVMAQSTRRIRRLETVEGEQKVIPYSHCSLCFCLEEIASLFKKKTEDVVNFLLEAYDCKSRYEYDTVGRGKILISMPCLNFFGGTTPDFMESVFDDAILNQGFSSRAWFIYASENRFNRMFISHQTPEQWSCRQHLVEHVRKLTRLCGELHFSKEASEFFTHWWEEEVGRQHSRTNRSVKLDAYFARKQIHAIKMAMIKHCSELVIEEKGEDEVLWNREITLATAQDSLATLAKPEETMHLALTFGGTNPFYKVGQAILRFLSNPHYKDTSLPFHSIFAEFADRCTLDELKEQILPMLIETGKIEFVNEGYRLKGTKE